MLTNKEVAQTILAQLGGKRFVTMTGASLLAELDQGLGFRLPSRFAKDGINSVEIHLNPSDTYTVTFKKIGPRPSLKRMLAGAEQTVTVVATISNVYCDMLQRIFTAHTGLDTHL